MKHAGSAEELLALLKQRGLTIGSCESFTAGAFCAALAAIPGASDVLKGGIVSYASEIKTRIAQVDSAVIDRYGVISEECAKAMAESARQVLQVDLCVSFTGNAGPDAWEGKPAGCIYCAIADAQTTQVYALQLDLPRNDVRSKAVEYMMEKTIAFIKR